MAFQLGTWVKFKNKSPIRLGFSLADIGQVVGVRDDSKHVPEIDVEFGKGHVVHGADGDWFEPVEPPALQN
jgi:hypothetical protein